MTLIMSKIHFNYIESSRVDSVIVTETTIVNIISQSSSLWWRVENKSTGANAERQASSSGTKHRWSLQGDI